jgi:hypothetical protein
MIRGSNGLQSMTNRRSGRFAVAILAAAIVMATLAHVAVATAGPDGGIARPADALPGPVMPGGLAANQDAGAMGETDRPGQEPTAISPTSWEPPATPNAHTGLTPSNRELRETAAFIDLPDAGPSTASKDERQSPGYLPGYRQMPSLSLSPYAPQGYWPALGIAPAFASRPPDGALHFEFHGYLQAPFRMGIGFRPNSAIGQNATTLHGDPVLPGSSFGWFDQTPTVPWPWAQGNFVIGNDVVSATAILGAWNFSESMTASTYFQNPAQVWFAQAFLDYTPKISSPIGIKIRAGAYPERYGAMGQYDLGAYPTPFIGYVRGVGATATVAMPFEYDLDLRLEAGFKGDINHPPTNLAPAPSNNFASAAQGSTFAAHAHAALSYRQVATLALHYIGAFERDDRPDGFDDPSTTQTIEALDRADSRLDVAGADLIVDGKRFGYFYLGAVKVDGHNVEHLNDLVQVLNTGSGKLLMQRYFGQQSHGNGGMLLFGTQYTVSLGTLLRYPSEFWGEGPDLLISIFGVVGSTNSDDPAMDGTKMLKYGTEVTYSFLSWLAVSGRIDHVVPDTRDMQASFAVFSPRITFRNAWQGSWRGGTLSLQYAAYVVGDHVIIHGDTRLMNNPSGRPDTQMLAILATLGW